MHDSRHDPKTLDPEALKRPGSGQWAIDIRRELLSSGNTNPYSSNNRTTLAIFRDCLRKWSHETRDTVKTDTLFYRLFQQLPALAFDLIGLEVPNADAYRFGSEEVKQTAFRLDGILFPPSTNPALPILFIEVQFQSDKEFYSRFFSEIFLYLRHCKAKNPWQSVVIYPDRRTEQNPIGHYDVLLESSRVHRIYLEDIAEQRTDEIGINLLQLITIEEKKAAVRAFSLVERQGNRIKISGTKDG